MVITSTASAARYVRRTRNSKTVGRSVGAYTARTHTHTHTRTHGEFLSSMTSIVNRVYNIIPLSTIRQSNGNKLFIFQLTFPLTVDRL